MKAHLRDQKIAAAKARDAAFVAALPKSYQPKQPLESSKQTHLFALTVLKRNEREKQRQAALQKEIEFQEKTKAYLERRNAMPVRGEACITITTPDGERRVIREVLSIRYEDNLILRPSDVIENK